MGAGFSRLNKLTIIQTSQGLAEYLLEEDPHARVAGVVIGHDARHNSEVFARLAAAAFIKKGIRVLYYEGLVHTPMVPFGVKTHAAAAGVMITASHNPALDNGYKVYGSNGCQINTPVDEEIAASILNSLEPISWKFDEKSSLLTPILPPTSLLYKKAVGTYLHQPAMTQTIPNFIYTPMHGVGLAPINATLGYASSKMTIVEEQAHPDPDFPTVNYPNPEEYGTLDLAKATADRADIHLIFANDPDADRFAAAEKVNGQWMQFTGDQVGVLLAFYIYTHAEPQLNSDDFMLVSAVSSQMLSLIAADAGFSVRETLTGFKWLGNCALDLERQGKRVHFAYEEALGYMFPSIVHDKDGVIAAGVFLNACAEWGSPWAKLQELYHKYGTFVTVNTYWRSPDVSTTSAIFEKVRQLGKPFPQTVGDRQILAWRDLTTGYDSSTKHNVPVLPRQSGQMITCRLGGNSQRGVEQTRFTVRASGTEPKIKIYLESHGENPLACRDEAAQVLNAVSREWFNDPKLVIEEKVRCL